MKTKLVKELRLAVLYVSFPCKTTYIYSEYSFYDHHGLFCPLYHMNSVQPVMCHDL